MNNAAPKLAIMGLGLFAMMGCDILDEDNKCSEEVLRCRALVAAICIAPLQPGQSTANQAFGQCLAFDQACAVQSAQCQD